ncbi:MAG: hypothetical protein QNI99_16720 [Woeseiaceae bacterium]|nr:hypothetical protein [Woeseiaceae bacterium]
MSFYQLREALRNRREPGVTTMSTEEFARWSEERVRLSGGVHIGPVNDDWVYQHRHASYMQGQDEGFLRGVIWTLTTLAWVAALALFAWFTAVY